MSNDAILIYSTLVALLSLVALAAALGLVPSLALAQQGFLPGGTEILSVSFATGGGLPPGVSIGAGNAEIVSKDGTAMLLDFRSLSPEYIPISTDYF